MVAPRNEGLHIIADVSGGYQSKAFIQFDYGTGFGPLEPIGNPRASFDPVAGHACTEYDYEYNPVLSDFTYVIHAGDNQSAPHRVRAVDRPRLDNLDLVYTLPDYISDKPTAPKRDTNIRGVVGSKAQITGESNKPLNSALIKLGDEKPLTLNFIPGGNTFTFQFPLEVTKDYEIFLTDTDGLDNHTSPIRHRIEVVQDKVPELSWKRPATDIEVTPAAVVSLQLAAKDDFGLQRAVIKFKRYRTVTPPAPAGGQNAPAPVIDTSTPMVEGTFDLTGEYGRDVTEARFH